MAEKRDQPVQGIYPDASVRTAALQVRIFELESQLGSIAETLAHEKAKSLALEASAARLKDIETELSAESSARDAAGAVAAAAVAELRELRLLYENLLRERATLHAERDIARAAVREAEARITELESKLVSFLIAGPENDLAPSLAEHRLEKDTSVTRASSPV